MNSIENISHGLKCDNPTCGWKDEHIPMSEWESYIDSPCPKCGQNILTREDFNNACMLIAMAELDLSNADLGSIIGDDELEEIKRQLTEQGISGAENLTKDGQVIVSFDTHKGIRMVGIQAVEPGYQVCDICNRNGCTGIIEEYSSDSSCSCHINPPCSHCTDPRTFCPECEWDLKEDQQ